MTIKELRKQLDNKDISAVEVAKQYIERTNATEEALNSYITVLPEEDILRAAEQAQKEIDAGNQRPLTGIPYAAKDLFCTKGVETTAGSRILKGYIPPYTATSVERLHDAVLMGKANLDEFAMGSSTEHSAYGPTHNPYDLDRVPGGSSGGSASSVAAGQAVFSLGTDTGGSVRLPASFCNVVGLKPTYGRISRYGVIAYASSFDTVGIFANTVEDTALVLRELAGPDGLDSTAPDVPLEDYVEALKQEPKDIKIGVPKELLALEGIDPKIRESFEKTVKQLEEAGYTVVETSLPQAEYTLAAYYILALSEASSNMARYDGIQYGNTTKNAQNLDEVFKKTRGEGFNAELKRRILIGTYCLSAGYFDAYYKRAQRMRTLAKQDFENAFEDVDIILAPTSPGLPFKIGEMNDDPVQMYAQDIFTIPISLAGMPAVTVPADNVDGLPVGVQFVAPQFQETRLLQVANHAQQVLTFEQPKLVV